MTGSIAAFKAAQLASDWVKQGHQVRVLMTAAAAQFVSPLTFQSLTHQSVRIAMFDDSGPARPPPMTACMWESPTLTMPNGPMCS